MKSDLEYLLDVVNLYDCEMSHRELSEYLKEAMKLKKRDEEKIESQFTLTEDEMFNEQ